MLKHLFITWQPLYTWRGREQSYALKYFGSADAVIASLNASVPAGFMCFGRDLAGGRYSLYIFTVMDFTSVWTLLKILVTSEKCIICWQLLSWKIELVKHYLKQT